MKHLSKFLFIVCLMLISLHSTQAQNSVTVNGVAIEDITLTPSGSRLDISMVFDLSNLEIRSNHSLRITPLLSDGREMLQLPAVVVDGRRRSIVHDRQSDDMFPSANTYVRRQRSTEQSVDYDANVTMQPWMKGSKLILREEWCSCHDIPYAEELLAIADVNTVMQNSPHNDATHQAIATDAKPRMAYAIPQSEAPSPTHYDMGIYFPINKSNIDPAFMGNKSALDSLSKLSTNNIKAIKLMGYASPEGPLEFNKSLAAKRAAAVKDYMTKNNIASSIPVSVDSATTDWEAIKEWLTASRIENYTKIIAIIDDNTIPEASKNATIRKQFPISYKFMFKQWYPKLRTTDISIEHNEKMDIAKAKQLIKENPAQLSLEDIYLVALTYEKGSKEWNDILLIAVKTYPQSPIARVNAANVAMANGDYAQAATYLQGLPSDMPEAMNSRGILAMSQGNYQQAMSLFEQAQKAGVSEATYNISLLKELMAAKP
ncbi:MAG: DUF3868 domain-containing protein [Alistipes sp.]|nr:DUF3868 domain-containing protein [Alistipes sp.]